jgi:hypothetical protein
MIYIQNKENKLFNYFLDNNVKKYNNEKLDYDDKLIVPIYLHYYAMHAIINKQYDKALLNNDFNNKSNPIIINNNINNINNIRLLLYNDYETVDFDTNIESVNIFILDYLEMPLNRVYISTPNYLNHMELTNNIILAYDWVYLRETNLNLNLDLSKTNKKYRIITLNRRSTYERYRYCLFLHKYHNDKTLFSYIGRNNNVHKYNVQHKLFNNNDINEFNLALPKELDGLNPNWSEPIDLINYFKQTYIFVTFETNIESFESQCCQVSEKSYKGIKLGIPFIIFSTKGGVLKHLHKMGFKTFSPYINEEYDNANLNYEERFDLLLKETERLCTISDIEMEELYDKIKDTLIYNFNILKNKNINNLNLLKSIY